MSSNIRTTIIPSNNTNVSGNSTPVVLPSVDQKYLAIPTNLGMQYIQQATWDQKPFEVVYMAYGDGGGEEYEPTPDMTALKNQLDIVTLQDKVVDLESGVTWFNAIFGADKANGVIREIGLYTANMDLIAIANTPEIHKVEVSTGAFIDVPMSLGIKNDISNMIIIPMYPSDDLATKSWVYAVMQNIVEIDCGTFDSVLPDPNPGTGEGTTDPDDGDNIGKPSGNGGSIPGGNGSGEDEDGPDPVPPVRS